MVLALPARGGRVGEIGEERAVRRVQPRDLVGQPRCRVQQLSVDVELPLLPCIVADSDRRAVAPPAQVRQLALGEITLATEAEHDLEVLPAA